MDVTGLAVPAFLDLLKARSELAADWLVRSIDACRQAGSSAYYSRIHHPLRGWAPAYPETTGLLMPTLIEYSRVSGRPDLAALAALQARWLMSIQSLDGSFPGGFHYAGQRGEPSVFATGQVILGLVAVADQTSDQEFLQCAAGAARWLCDELNEPAGIWLPQPQAAFQPAHYARVCWAMLEVWRRTREERIRSKALRGLESLASWQQPSGGINNWGLQPDRPAFTDNIAHTLRGLMECGRVLGQDGKRFIKIATRAAEALRERTKDKGQPAGAYDPHLNADESLSCLPGSCHLAQIWLRLAAGGHDIDYFRVGISTVWAVLRKQNTHSPVAAKRGALPAASPAWGRYWRLRLPNWAGSALLDALMEARRTIERCPAEPHDPDDVALANR